MTFLWALAAKATLVLMLGGLAATSLRRGSASSRHVVWAIALAALALLPALGYVLPRWEVAVLPPLPAPVPAEAGLYVEHETLVPTALPFDDVLSARADEPPSPASRAWSWRDAVLPLWLLGAIFGLAQLSLGTILMAATARRGRPMSDEAWSTLLSEARDLLGLRRSVDVRVTPTIALPIVWGYWRPVVLLPEDADRWPIERRRAFLLHELAHVARYDCFTQTLAYVARALYWPHPLVWWAVNALRREAERACDDRVVAAGTDAPEYAQHLLEAARRLPRAARPLATASAVVEGTRLGDRLLALLDESLNRRAVTRRTVVVVGGAALIAIAFVATVQPVARAAVAEAVRAAVAAAVPTQAALPAGAPPVASESAAPRPRVAASPALHGVVKAPDGKPIANAVVIVSGPSRGIGAPGRIESTRSDDAGAFRVDGFAGSGPYDVRVDAPGLARETIWGVSPAAPLAIVLGRGGRIEGTVSDAATRRPVAQAQVTVSLVVPQAGEAHTRRILATTDDQGRYRLEALPPGVHQVIAAAAGYFEDQRRAAVSTRVDFFLRSGGASIVGILRDPEGKPVSDASIVADQELPVGPVGPATSDSAGRFELKGIEPGRYRLLVRHAKWAPALAADVTATSKPTPIGITLERPYQILGRLVTTDERPVKGHVMLQALEGSELPAALAQQYVADAGMDGRFRLAGLPAGALTLAVRPLQFAPSRAEIVIGGKDRAVDVGDLRVELGHTIRGRVRTKDGQPIADAHVYTPAAADPGDTRTDADGGFVMAGVRVGTQGIAVAAHGYADARRSADADGPPIEIVMEPEAAVAGILVDASGRPVSGAAVIALNEQRHMRPSKLTEGDGRFKIGHLPSGSYSLQVQPREHLDKTVTDVELKVGRTTDVGRIVLEPGAAIHGVVVDGSGGPVAGAQVTVQDAAQQRRSNDFGQVQRPVTDLQGHFTLRGLSSGVAKLGASHPSFAPSAPIEVAVDPEAPADVRLTLVEGARVTGTARQRDGRPVPNAFVVVHDSSLWGGELRQRSMIDAEGRFAIEHVAPGRANVVLMEGSAGRYVHVVEKQVDLRDGAAVDVSLDVLDVLVSGRVTRGGKPVSSHRVRLSVGGGGGLYTGARTGVPAAARVPRLEAETKEDGSYELIVPGPGKYQVLVRPMVEATRGGMPRIDDVVVPDVPTFRHDIPLADWSVIGRVTARDTRRPLERALVSARPVSGEPGGASTRTDAEGRFRLALDAGPYVLHIQAPKYVALESRFDASGAFVERNAALAPGGAITGRVTNAAGAARPGVTVAAVSPDSRSIRTGRSEADGAFSVDGLESGSYLLFAADGERPDFALHAGVLAGDGPLSLALSSGATVRIAFKHADGKPLVDTSVRVDFVGLGGVWLGAEGRCAMSQTQTTDDAGIAEYRLPAGAVDVIAATPTRLRGEAKLSVPSGASSTAEMELRPRR